MGQEVKIELPYLQKPRSINFGHGYSPFTTTVLKLSKQKNNLLTVFLQTESQPKNNRKTPSGSTAGEKKNNCTDPLFRLSNCVLKAHRDCECSPVANLTPNDRSFFHSPQVKRR